MDTNDRVYSRGPEKWRGESLSKRKESFTRERNRDKRPEKGKKVGWKKEKKGRIRREKKDGEPSYFIPLNSLEGVGTRLQCPYSIICSWKARTFPKPIHMELQSCSPQLVRLTFPLFPRSSPLRTLFFSLSLSGSLDPRNPFVVVAYTLSLSRGLQTFATTLGRNALVFFCRSSSMLFTILSLQSSRSERTRQLFPAAAC